MKGARKSPAGALERIEATWWAVILPGHRQPVGVFPSRVQAEGFKSAARFWDAEVLPVDVTVQSAVVC